MEKTLVYCNCKSFEKALEESKKHVANYMGFEESRLSDIPKKATFPLIIVALQKNLSRNVVNILFAGAKTQDIVDLVNLCHIYFWPGTFSVFIYFEFNFPVILIF